MPWCSTDKVRVIGDLVKWLSSNLMGPCGAVKEVVRSVIYAVTHLPGSAEDKHWYVEEWYNSDGSFFT